MTTLVYHFWQKSRKPWENARFIQNVPSFPVSHNGGDEDNCGDGDDEDNGDGEDDTGSDSGVHSMDSDSDSYIASDISFSSAGGVHPSHHASKFTVPPSKPSPGDSSQVDWRSGREFQTS